MVKKTHKCFNYVSYNWEYNDKNNNPLQSPNSTSSTRAQARRPRGHTHSWLGGAPGVQAGFHAWCQTLVAKACVIRACCLPKRVNIFNLCRLGLLKHLKKKVLEIYIYTVLLIKPIILFHVRQGRDSGHIFCIILKNEGKHGNYYSSALNSCLESNKGMLVTTGRLSTTIFHVVFWHTTWAALPLPGAPQQQAWLFKATNTWAHTHFFKGFLGVCKPQMQADLRVCVAHP